MTYSNNNYRMCVFRSPERYEDYHREYIEIPHPASMNHLNTLNSFIEENRTVPNEPMLQIIRLRRYRWSWHIENQLLEDFGIKKEVIKLDYNICTICNKSFCSYRRDRGKDLSYQITVAYLK